MKKLFAILSVAAVVLASCGKDDDNGTGGGTGSGSLDVKKKNLGILIDFSETSCSYCGSNGGPGFDSSLSIEGASITAMKVYSSSSPGSLNSPISSGLKQAYNVSGIPDFYFNNTALSPTGGVYNTAAANFNWVKNKAVAFSTDSIVAGIALTKSFIGDSAKVTTRVKFFKEQAAGVDYRLAVYLVEDNIVSNQNTTTGAVPNYVHRNLLRSCNASTYTGVSLNSSAAIAADQVFDNTFMLPKNSITGIASNLKAIAVIWKMGSTPAKVVNSNVVK